MAYSIFSGIQQTFNYPVSNENSLKVAVSSSDVRIQFHSAKDLPKMDVIGSADPYFIAQIDDGRIEFVSACIPNTLTPIWNEQWIVRNVPSTAKLSVRVFDKDDDTVKDDYIGQFQVDLVETDHQSIPILNNWGKARGEFQLSIHRLPSSPDTCDLRLYTFDGPVRYSRNNSLTVGRLAKLNEERLYSTWEIHLKGIDFFFDPSKKQKWNSSYKAAKSIFEGPMSHGVQTLIKRAHKVLYAKHTTNEFGSLNSGKDLWRLLTDDTTKSIKLCIYTYIIEDYTWRFSETGAAFFVDFASKHALHSNCAETVRYAGEFHPRPVCGWDHYNPADPIDYGQWELAIDNGSGTYAPDLSLLVQLKKLLLFNFPGLNIVTYDYKDPRLKSSIEACRTFAKTPRQSMRTIQQLMLVRLGD